MKDFLIIVVGMIAIIWNITILLIVAENTISEVCRDTFNIIQNYWIAGNVAGKIVVVIICTIAIVTGLPMIALLSIVYVGAQLGRKVFQWCFPGFEKE